MQLPDSTGQQQLVAYEEECDPAPAPAPGSKKTHAHRIIEDDDGDSSQDEKSAPLMEEEFIKMVAVPKTEKAFTPPSFFEREAFRDLNERGLANLPPGQYALWYHVSSSQWHAHNKVTGKNFAPTWGKKRSETCAVLLALAQLWKWFVEDEPLDAEGQAYLALLESEIQTSN